MIRAFLVVAALLSAASALAGDPRPSEGARSAPVAKAAPAPDDDVAAPEAPPAPGSPAAAHGEAAKVPGDTNGDGSDADELAVRKAIAEVEADRAAREAAAEQARAAAGENAGAPATTTPTPTPTPSATATPPAPPIDMRELPAPSSGLVDLIGPLIKTMLMLAVVVGLAYLTLSKGLGKLVERQNLGKRVKVVERVALDAKRSLYLVDVDGKQMLIGAADGGVVLLRDVETKAAPAAVAPAAASFADALFKRAGSSTAVTPAPTTTTPDEKASA